MLDNDLAKHCVTAEQYPLDLYIDQDKADLIDRDYQPGVTVQDFSSKGQTWRVLGRTTGRLHQLMSKLEYMAFTLVDLNPAVIDIQEQFPHELKTSLAVANKLGINHSPQNEEVKSPLTTDLVIHIDVGVIKKVGIYVKYAKDLDYYRTIEKLELERKSLEELGIPLYVVTEADISELLFKNLDWILMANVEDTEADLTVEHAINLLKKMSRQGHRKLTTFLKNEDILAGLKSGTHLHLCKCFLQLGYFHFDLNKSFLILRCEDIYLNKGIDNNG